MEAKEVMEDHNELQKQYTQITNDIITFLENFRTKCNHDEQNEKCQRFIALQNQYYQISKEDNKTMYECKKQHWNKKDENAQVKTWKCINEGDQRYIQKANTIFENMQKLYEEFSLVPK